MRILELDVSAALKSKKLQYVADKYGWKPLGRGAYGWVFEHPTKNYVIKVFSSNRSYENFVKFARLNSTNIHIPKISKDARVIPGTSFKYVKMEKLQPISEETLNTKYFSELAYIIVKLAKFDLQAPDHEEAFVVDQLKKHGLEFNQLRQLRFADIFAKFKKPDQSWIDIVDKLILYAENVGEVYFDIHYQNFMLRNNTLVITDPF